MDLRVCSYCGLPANTTSSGNQDASSGEVFCCLGCRIAAGITRVDDESTGPRSALTRLGLAIFFTMNVMVFTLVLWTWNLHDLPDDSRIRAFREILRYACLLFTGPVLILLGGPLIESSFLAWKQKRITTDALLLLGVCAAVGYSVLSLLLGLPDIYFEVACMILVAVTLGKWLEATAKFKATQALRSLRNLLPEMVRRLSDSAESVVPLEAIRPDDRLRVLAGERIPVDGLLESATCTVDEQVITGESIPRTKDCGASLYGGTLNLAGEILVRASCAADAGAIARLAKAVEDATQSNCSAIRLADRLSGWFVPVIIVTSMIAFVVHVSLGIQNGIMASLSVVLIACPCALGIATPLALWVCINTAARHGVLFRNGDAVVSLAKVRSIAFDKTGTVTSGDVRLVKEFYDDSIDRKLVQSVACQLANSSNHVLSRVVAKSLNLRLGDVMSAGNSTIMLSRFRDHPGRGVSAHLQFDNVELTHKTTVVVLGSPQFAIDLGMRLPSGLATQIEHHPDLAVVCFGWAGRIQAVFLLGESLRTETEVVFLELHDMNLHTAILTGDHRARAAVMERLVGVQTIGQLLPEEKSAELQKLQKPVAMVGDGMNDSLALATADVGIALDCGADVSRDAADICLLGSSLAKLPWAIHLTRATGKTIRRNLVWAVGYNAIGMGFAVSGRLNPIIAAIAMVGSSLFVLTNSLRLSSFSTATSKSEELLHKQRAGTNGQFTEIERNDSTREPEVNSTQDSDFVEVTSAAP